MWLKYIFLAQFVLINSVAAQQQGGTSANVTVKLLEGIVFRVEKISCDVNFLGESSYPKLSNELKNAILLRVGAKPYTNLLIHYDTADSLYKGSTIEEVENKNTKKRYENKS